MSTGFMVAVDSAEFLDLLDREEESLAASVLDAKDSMGAAAAMDSSRQRLARAVDKFVRALPTVIRNDSNLSQQAAYALVGLADERMLHHPAGGLEKWRERLLEYELYGSAVAGQEIVMRAKDASSGVEWAAPQDDRGGGSGSILAPLYLAVFKAGFEGSLRGDSAAIRSLIATLEETIGNRQIPAVETPLDQRPKRVGLAPLPLALAGIALWLGSGFAVWALMAEEPLEEISQIADRMKRGESLELQNDLFDNSLGPVTAVPDSNGISTVQEP